MSALGLPPQVGRRRTFPRPGTAPASIESCLEQAAGEGSEGLFHIDEIVGAVGGLTEGPALIGSETRWIDGEKLFVGQAADHHQLMFGSGTSGAPMVDSDLTVLAVVVRAETFFGKGCRGRHAIPVDIGNDEKVALIRGGFDGMLITDVFSNRLGNDLAE